MVLAPAPPARASSASACPAFSTLRSPEKTSPARISACALPGSRRARDRRAADRRGSWLMTGTAAAPRSGGNVRVRSRVPREPQGRITLSTQARPRSHNPPCSRARGGNSGLSSGPCRLIPFYGGGPSPSAFPKLRAPGYRFGSPFAARSRRMSSPLARMWAISWPRPCAARRSPRRRRPWARSRYGWPRPRRAPAPASPATRSDRRSHIR